MLAVFVFVGAASAGFYGGGSGGGGNSGGGNSGGGNSGGGAGQIQPASQGGSSGGGVGLGDSAVGLQAPTEANAMPGSGGAMPSSAAGMAGTAPQNSGADAADEKPEAPAKVSLADAVYNFETVVESYVAKKSAGGVWTYKEDDRTSKLVLVSVDSKSVRAAGEGLYAGVAVLRDARTKRVRRLEFTADFSGPKWTVVSVRPVPKAR